MACAQFTKPMIRARLLTRKTGLFRAWAGTVVLFVALCVGWTPAAWGQAVDVETLIEQGKKAGANVEQMRAVATRARQAGLGADAASNLLRPAVELAEQGLPTSPLLTKSLEGLAKNVPPSRMNPVLAQLRSHTERAGQMVSQWTQRADVKAFLGASDNASEQGPPERARTRLITAITNAQQQEIPAETIADFLNNLPSAVERRPVQMGAVATAVSVLPELPGDKASSKASRRLLSVALDAGYSRESLRQLPAALQSAGRASQRPPGVLVASAAQAIAKGTPAADVLQGLFQGSVPGVGPPGGRGGGPPGSGPGNGKPPGQGGKPPGAGPPTNPGGGQSGNSGGSGSG